MTAATTAPTRTSSAIRRVRPRCGIACDCGRRRRRATAGAAGSWRTICPESCLEVGARLEPEIVVEPTPRLLVDLERLRVPSAAIEREHELRDEALAVRVLRDELLELADRLLVAAERELGVEAQLVRAEPQLLEPVGLGAPCRRERDVGERGPAPHRERGGRQLDDIRVLVHRRGERRALLQLDEATRVQRAPRRARAQ